jgi:hypothetical protein
MHAAAYIYSSWGCPCILNLQHCNTGDCNHRLQPQAATSLFRKERRHISASDFIQHPSVQVQRAHSPPGYLTQEKTVPATSNQEHTKRWHNLHAACCDSCTCTNSQHPRTTSNGGSKHSVVHHPRQPRIPLFQPGWVETRTDSASTRAAHGVSDQQHCAALHKQHCNHQISRHKPPETAQATTLLARQPTITKLAQGPS